MNNPLTNIKLPWFLNWIISQTLGSQWRTKLWVNTLTAVQEFLSTNTSASPAAVESFLTSHVNDFVSALVRGNIFLATAIETALDPLFTAIVASAYTEAEAAIAAAQTSSAAEVVPHPEVAAQMGEADPNAPPAV